MTSNGNGNPPNFLTVDVEEYFHVNYPGCDVSSLENERTNVEALLDRILLLFADAGIHGTFFTLGVVAEKYPSMIRSIHAAGHEVASHGYSHKEVRAMTAAEFRDDLERSCGILEAQTGVTISGYRAPSFSVDTESASWFYDALEDRGLTYSSSVFPGRTFLYGIPGSPQCPHRPVMRNRQSRVIELPMTSFEIFGKRFPLYVRLLSAGLLERMLRDRNRAGCPGILYVHPREIDTDSSKLPLSPTLSLIHYWGVRGCEAKLRQLSRQPLHFCRMGDYVATLSDQ